MCQSGPNRAQSALAVPPRGSPRVQNGTPDRGRPPPPQIRQGCPAPLPREPPARVRLPVARSPDQCATSPASLGGPGRRAPLPPLGWAMDGRRLRTPDPFGGRARAVARAGLGRRSLDQGTRRGITVPGGSRASTRSDTPPNASNAKPPRCGSAERGMESHLARRASQTSGATQAPPLRPTAAQSRRTSPLAFRRIRRLAFAFVALHELMIRLPGKRACTGRQRQRRSPSPRRKRRARIASRPARSAARHRRARRRSRSSVVTCSRSLAISSLGACASARDVATGMRSSASLATSREPRLYAAMLTTLPLGRRAKPQCSTHASRASRSRSPRSPPSGLPRRTPSTDEPSARLLRPS